MIMGLIGRKCGMTQIYAENNEAIPVTVIEILPNRVVQVKTKERDGYESVQVTTDKKSSSRLNKPKAGHFAKANVEPGDGLWEFPIEGQKKGKSEDEQGEGDAALLPGKEVTVDIFDSLEWVDVIGITKGKGFSGPVKRYKFSMQDATHGNSLSHRAHGSIGQRQSPGRVFKGKKMAGQLGNRRRTIQSLKLVRIDVIRNLLYVKGAIPGAPGGKVIVRPAVRKKNKQNKN
jgi:large subunit ribosomal protein L3